MADPAVWITGTGPDKQLNFRLPTGGKGDKGDKGDKGADGSNVLPTDTAIATAINASGSATKTALSATIASGISAAPVNVRPSRRDGAAGLFDAATLIRQTSPVRIVFLGSSTTAGYDVALTDSYVYKLMQKIQATYPNGGTESTIGNLDSAKITTPGFHAYNGAVGGNMSSYYLNGTDQPKVKAIDPMIVVHMVGSNDYANNVTPTAYKGYIESALTYLRANLTGPVLHILAHQHHRLDVAAPAYPWSAYRDALASIADASKDVLFLNLGDSFDPIVGTTDPFNFVKPDNIHLNPIGHTLLADLFFAGLAKASASGASTATSSALTLHRLTSDTASGANATDINGRATDARLGGSTRTWASDPALAVAITSNAFVRGSSTAAFAANVPEYVMDIEMSFTITTRPTGTEALIVDLHRQGAAVAGTPDTYRMWLYPGGGLDMGKRQGGAQPVLATGGTYNAGDRISFRHYKGKLEVRKNGSLMLTANDATITAPGFAGFAGSANAGWVIDDVTLDAVG